MSEIKPSDFANIYARFSSSVTSFDCGEKCGPYNEYGIPFCCDINHAVPTAFGSEWEYLKSNTSLWHIWNSDDPEYTAKLYSETPEGLVLIQCLGYQQCQRNFRSITCRAFPFFPYINSMNEFLGLTYYWEYEERCWVINYLEKVTQVYIRSFVAVYEELFEHLSDEFSNFCSYSTIMRKIFGTQNRKIPLLHRDGGTYLVVPENEKCELINPVDLPKYGPYKVAAQMPFADEI